MKFFVDTADTSEIQELSATGIVDGVTTNPSLTPRTSRPFKDAIQRDLQGDRCPVLAEVTATDLEGMLGLVFLRVQAPQSS